jgi:hypothetical protein
MSIKKRIPELPHNTLEPDRLQRELSAAARAQAAVIKRIRWEMNHTAANSVLEAMRSDKRK